ncbi:MAG: hypothetical protein ACYDD6_05255, partial [Acidimicrobiales bacterium]
MTMGPSEPSTCAWPRPRTQYARTLVAGAATSRLFYYTSGTTSEPKGVRHTDLTLVNGGRGLAMALDLSEQDVGSI